MAAEANMIASVRQVEERKHFADKMNGFDKRHLDTEKEEEKKIHGNFKWSCLLLWIIPDWSRWRECREMGATRVCERKRRKEIHLMKSGWKCSHVRFDSLIQLLGAGKKLSHPINLPSVQSDVGTVSEYANRVSTIQAHHWWMTRNHYSQREKKNKWRDKWKRQAIMPREEKIYSMINGTHSELNVIHPLESIFPVADKQHTQLQAAD